MVMIKLLNIVILGAERIERVELVELHVTEERANAITRKMSSEWLLNQRARRYSKRSRIFRNIIIPL